MNRKISKHTAERKVLVFCPVHMIWMQMESQEKPCVSRILVTDGAHSVPAMTLKWPQRYVFIRSYRFKWRSLAVSHVFVKILAKAEEFGQYAFPDGPNNSNGVGIAVDFCLSTDTSGQATINACSPGYSSVGIACHNPDLGADHINTSKGAGGMFYCDLGSIGLMEKRGKAWKEIKYNLKKCIKKRANGEKPRNILVKPKGTDIKKRWPPSLAVHFVKQKSSEVAFVSLYKVNSNLIVSTVKTKIMFNGVQ